MSGRHAHADAGSGSGSGWHRVHRATPLLRAWTALLALAAAVAVNVQASAYVALWGLLHGGPWWILPAALGAVVVLCALIWLVSGIWWRATGYRITDEEVELRRGVLNRQLRTARFDRVQAVDVAEPLIPRLFGLASVKVETAGGTDSHIDILYLPRAVAEALRRDLLARVRGGSIADVPSRPSGGSRTDGRVAGAGAGTAGADGAGTNAASGAWGSEGSGVGSVSAGAADSWGDAGTDAAPGAWGESSAEDGAGAADAPAGWAGQGSGAPVASAGPVDEDRLRGLVEEIPARRALGAAALSANTVVGVVAAVLLIATPIANATVIGVLLAVVPSVWRVLNTSWLFTAKIDDADRVLHLNYGLTERRRQAVPLDRVHAVKVSQTPLWRLVGWWQVQVSVAGYGGPLNSKTESTTTVLPVGSRETALAVFAEITGMDPGEIERVATPEGRGAAQFTSPAIARWVSPVDRRQQGVTLAEDRVITHHGRVGRTVETIETSHIQELSLTQGPIQRLLGLATVRLDLVPGPVYMKGRDLAHEDAEALVEKLRDRRLPALTGAGQPGRRI